LGQDKIKNTCNASTGLTGAQAGLTGVSSQFDRCIKKGSRCSTPKKRARWSFKELLAPYKREETTRNQSNQPNGAKGVKAPPRCEIFITNEVIFSSQYPLV
jgi:hypothetical protein